MITLTLPEDIFRPLFQDVALSGLIRDGKSLADAVPIHHPAEILSKYETEKMKPDFDMGYFLHQHFEFPIQSASDFHSDTNAPLEDHIEKLWSVLTRKADLAVEGSSLIALPFPYIVPGGRFNEIYYWDSYFTMLGLKVSGRIDLMVSMIDNFAWLIDQVGFIPNGNRTYFLSRSQPPFFSLMVTLLAEVQGEQIYVKYIRQLEKEYDFWMDGTSDTIAKESKHIVHIEKDHVLNRYWDTLDTPRSEMYADDVHLVHSAQRPSESLLRDIRCACESGWDFSSRWCLIAKELSSIHTSNILPVDLNCLLYHLEITLAEAFDLSGNREHSTSLWKKSENRKNMIIKYFWNEDNGYFFDFDFKAGKQTESIHPGGIFPLAFSMVDQEKGKLALAFMQAHLLKAGGLMTTTMNTGQQWDAPNGWAPLQWMAFRAALMYQNTSLCMIIANRWTLLNERVFKQTGKMMEKYNVAEPDKEGGGGEYPVQDGFGWTNGVYLAMKYWISENEETQALNKSVDL